MNRGEFVRTLCTLGACSCASFALAGRASALAGEDSKAELEGLKWKLDFMRKRFAKLVGILSDNLDAGTRKKVFESMGRECARMFFDITGKFAGEPEAFLEEIKKRWAKETEYNQEAGKIRVVDKSDHCTCAFVDEKLTPPAFCDCTLGWQKETYAMILGEPVDAELEESVLRGGKRCIFRVQAVRKAA
jgi:predicted hydrocarbon binding protein